MARAIKGVPISLTDDIIFGSDGDDHIVVTGGNDTVYAGKGNDHIVGNSGDDTLHGNEGDDKINAGLGNDHIWGDQGNDDLQGGNGADVFHYSFHVETGASKTFTFSGFDLGSDNVLTQTEFSHQYDAWLETLGTDLDLNLAVTVSNNGGSSSTPPAVEGFTGTFSMPKETTVVATGGTTQTRYFSDEATVAGSGEVVTSTDGHDHILDFHFGDDKLDFGGITKAQFLDHFVVDQTQDVDGDGGLDTVIAIRGDTTFNIALLGVQGYSLNDFANDGIIFHP
jgi:Ca2+-binding RTX toxin-like protein